MADLGLRIVFVGSEKQPSYVTETCSFPREEDLGEGEILVKLLIATLCPSDLKTVDGFGEGLAPCVMGHEGVGEIALLPHNSAADQNLKIGDRVAFTPVNYCGCCTMCHEELWNNCEQLLKYGRISLKDGTGFHGTFATHIVLRRGTHVVRIPDNVSDYAASPANCALATMIHAISFALPTDKRTRSLTALVQGAGLLGLYACGLLHDAGYENIYCQDVNSDRLRLVSKFNGIPILVENYSFKSNYLSLPDRVDTIVDVSNGVDAIYHGLSLLCSEGTYILVGKTNGSKLAQIDINIIIQKCIKIKGVCGYMPHHLDSAIDFLSRTSHLYPYDALVSSHFPLREFHNAVFLARSCQYHRVAVKPDFMQSK